MTLFLRLSSAFFNKGKSAALKLLQKDKVLVKSLRVFYQRDASREELIRVGESFVLKLYAANKDVDCINKLRYIKFNQVNARQSLNKQMDLASLPSTKSALNQHLFRVYHQVQQWCGDFLDPLQWGWLIKGHDLYPNLGVNEVAPKFIMEMIFCNCKKSQCLTLCAENLAYDALLSAAIAVACPT